MICKTLEVTKYNNNNNINKDKTHLERYDTNISLGSVFVLTKFKIESPSTKYRTLWVFVAYIFVHVCVCVCVDFLVKPLPIKSLPSSSHLKSVDKVRFNK